MTAVSITLQREFRAAFPNHEYVSFDYLHERKIVFDGTLSIEEVVWIANKLREIGLAPLTWEGT